MEPVVSPELLRSPDDADPKVFVNVVLATEVPKRNIGTILKALKKAKLGIGDEELQYLKKVDEESILLCKDEDYDNVVPEVTKSGALAGAKVQRGVKVPGQPPLTKEQADEWNKRWWKTAYRPLQAELLPPAYPSKEEIKKYEGYMREAIKEAKLAQESGNKKVGCVIVDPKKGEIVSRAGDCSVKEGGLCIEHACIHAINNFKSTDSYICTGFDVFVTQEPCIMCSMALVHSRVGRVFWGVPNDENGGLGTVYQLHLVKQLNHHFQVWRYLLRDEILLN